MYHARVTHILHFVPIELSNRCRIISVHSQCAVAISDSAAAGAAMYDADPEGGTHSVTAIPPQILFEKWCGTKFAVWLITNSSTPAAEKHDRKCFSIGVHLRLLRHYDNDRSVCSRLEFSLFEWYNSFVGIVQKFCLCFCVVFQ